MAKPKDDGLELDPLYMGDLRKFIKSNPEGIEIKIAPQEIIAVLAHIQTSNVKMFKANPQYGHFARQFGRRLQAKIPSELTWLHQALELGWPGGKATS